MSTPEDRAVEALRWAINHPDAEGGCNLRDAVREIGNYVLDLAREERERAEKRAVNATLDEALNSGDGTYRP